MRNLISENLLIFTDYIKKIYQNRYMVKSLALRELKTQYEGSVFGLLWAVTNPLAQVANNGIIFGLFFKSKPDLVYYYD